jgi:ADP-heptose:LPS heptosyltransferase
MRFLLCRTDGIGDLVTALPVQACILAEDPRAEIFWLVGPGAAPALECLPGVSGVLRRPPDGGGDDLAGLIKGVGPDALLNLYHRDMEIVGAASRAGVPAIVARPRRWRHLFEVTHPVLANHHDSSRHQSQHNLDFLRAYRWPVPESVPPPRLVLTQEETERGSADLAGVPAPRLGLVTGGNAGAGPGPGWWEKMIEASKRAGWNPAVLSPPDAASLPPAGLRGLMARLRACDAVLGVSTGPTHLAAALEVPTLCLMGRRRFHGPARWTPLGLRVGALQYEGEEDDMGAGMDRFSPDDVLARLEGLCRG